MVSLAVVCNLAWPHGSVCCLAVFWSVCPWTNLHTALKWLGFLHSPDFFIHAGHCLSRCLVVQYVKLSTLICLLWAPLSCFGVPFLTVKLWSLMLFSTTFCNLLASTLWANNNTPSLTVSSLFSSIDSSSKCHIIPTSSSPFMNCSVSNLSYSVYLFTSFCL